MKKISQLILFAVMLSMYSYSKGENKQLPVQQVIITLQANNEIFYPIHLFNAPEERTLEGIGTYIHYMIDKNELQKAFKANYQSIKLALPMPDGTVKYLLLTQHKILADDFNLTVTDERGQHTIQYTPGLYYFGMIEGFKQRSMVACSVFNDELACVVGDESGNWNLGPLKPTTNNLQGNESEYVYYNDETFHFPLKFTCGINEGDAGESMKGSRQNPGINSVSPCIKIFFDCAHDIYDSLGNNTNTVSNYVTTLFNVEATLFFNESITVSIQSIHVWTVADPFDYSGIDPAWISFKTYYIPPSPHSYPGDIAQLLSTQTNGGTAFIASACAPPSIGVFSFSGNMELSFMDFPTYSWDAMVITHEDGHVLGSDHTHACVWNGNYTAIDGCVTPTTCPDPGLPIGGGTIMSYCHNVTGVGINFANGFGTQPGDTIRYYVANQSCFTSCTCPSVFSVTNPIFSGFSLQYSASAIIYGNNVVSNGATVLYSAGNAVDLNPGFIAQTGSLFTAQIAPCTPSPNPVRIKPADNSNNSFAENNDVEITPNPFNSTFQLSIHLKEDDKGRIAIYNVLGLKVKETQENNFKKGFFTISFDCSDIAPGVYFIEIYIGDAKTVKRILKS